MNGEKSDNDKDDKLGRMSNNNEYRAIKRKDSVSWLKSNTRPGLLYEP